MPAGGGQGLSLPPISNPCQSLVSSDQRSAKLSRAKFFSCMRRILDVSQLVLLARSLSGNILNPGIDVLDVVIDHNAYCML
jgi:hypothetical protein